MFFWSGLVIPLLMSDAWAACVCSLQGSAAPEPPAWLQVVFGRLGLCFARLSLPAWHWHPPRLREPICQAQLVGGAGMLHVLCAGSRGWREQRSLSAEGRRAMGVASSAPWWLWNTFESETLVNLTLMVSENVPRVVMDLSLWGCSGRAVSRLALLSRPCHR